jgi:hypothetical protein
MKPQKKIPTFKDEDAEREFWATADSTEYIDWSKAQRISVPNFRLTLRKSASRKKAADVVAPPARRLYRQRLAGASRYLPPSRRRYRAGGPPALRAATLRVRYELPDAIFFCATTRIE